MQIHAVVPVKTLARAKSRLAGRLSLAERRDLVIAMLGRVLATLLSCRGAAQHRDHQVAALGQAQA
ncbi:MAG: hypothetical protein WCI67_18430, partial [Chloroflexales bacterium]